MERRGEGRGRQGSVREHQRQSLKDGDGQSWRSSGEDPAGQCLRAERRVYLRRKRRRSK